MLKRWLIAALLFWLPLLAQAAVDLAGTFRKWDQPCSFDPSKTCGTQGALEPLP